LSKRRSRQLSVLVIPDDGSHTLEFKMGYWLLWTASSALLVLFILVIVGGSFYLQARYWERNAQALQRENRRLRADVEQVDELAQTVVEIKQLDQQLRHMLSPNLSLPPVVYSVAPASYALAGDAESTVQVSTVAGRSGAHTQASLNPRWIPSIWPVSKSLGWVTAEFEGEAGVLHKRHQGIDIAAPEGTLVLATADGKVAFAGVDAVLGQVVAIDHYAAFMTRYGHNASILVSEGEQVRKGQPIAQVGNSGRSSGPHLHYEVVEGGRHQNPRLYLPE